jgi:hypothetical protein
MLKGYTIIEYVENGCLLHQYSCARLIMLRYTRRNIVIYSAKTEGEVLFRGPLCICRSCATTPGSNSKQTYFLWHHTTPHAHCDDFCNTLGLLASCSTVGWASVPAEAWRDTRILNLHLESGSRHSMHIVKEVYKSDVSVVNTNGLWRSGFEYCSW